MKPKGNEVFSTQGEAHAWTIVAELRDKIIELEDEIRKLRAAIGFGGN